MAVWQVRVLSWSPDGAQIAYHSHAEDDRNAEIYLVNVDGTNDRQVTDNEYADRSPAWIP